MRKLVLFVMLSTTAAISVADPKPKATLLFSIRGHSIRDPAVTRDGRRIYYVQDTTDLYMYDRTTRRSTRVPGSYVGVGSDLAVSPTGDRLLFARSNEDGSGRPLWIVALDPSTGMPNGAARRVSMATASSPAFSPDGKSVAFASPRGRTTKNLVVVPVNGGPERTVAETQGDVWPITWPSADSIYFGLSFEETQNATKNGVYHVGASGGTPRLVLRTADWGNYPGMSPDGRFILGFDSTWDSVLIATPAGRRIHAYQPNEPVATPDVSIGGGKAIGWRQVPTSSVRVIDLTNGKEHAAVDSAEYRGPILSPDGRRVAAVEIDSSRLVVADLVNGTRRSIPLKTFPAQRASVYWSPDGRSIVYREMHQGALELVDLGSGKVRQIAPRSSLGPVPRWKSDSRAIVYTIVTPDVTSDAVRKIEVREVTVDGQDRSLHSFDAPAGLPRNNTVFGKFIDDSLLSMWAKNEYHIVNVRSRGAPRVAYKRDGTPGQPVPNYSANGHWMAVRRQSPSDQHWSIELMHPDGSAHKSIPVPFAVMPGGSNPWVRDDGAEVIVWSGACPGGAAGTGACVTGFTAYRLDVATGKSTAIAATSRAVRPLGDVSLSADGRRLVYLSEIESRVDMYEFDFNEILKIARP